jgi:hypothetical protein
MARRPFASANPLQKDQTSSFGPYGNRMHVKYQDKKTATSDLSTFDLTNQIKNP